MNKVKILVFIEVFLILVNTMKYLFIRQSGLYTLYEYVDLF
jgi:hypothetical protein